MTQADDQARRDAGQARMAGLVMAVTMLLWLGLQVAGSRLGWAGKYAYLFDLAAIAAFVWSLAVTFRLWRRRRA